MDSFWKGMRRIAVVTLVLGTSWSCQTDDHPPSIDANSSLGSSGPDQMTVLGKEQGIPYTLENMKQAYENLQSKSGNARLASDVEIKTTHLYVRFAPKTEAELELITDDTTEIFFDIPLNYEIAEPGIYYHDPELPDSVPTYQYATLPVRYDFPKVEYQILEELYMPDEDSELENARTSGESWIDEWIDEAEILAGTLEETSGNARVNSSKWTPFGYVKVYNPSSKYYEPVEGLEVIARRGLKSKKGKTNNVGFFKCDGRFRHSVKYLIKWERYQFSIKDNGSGDAKWESGSTKSYLDAKFGSASDPYATQRFFAQIFRAAYHYYYQDIQGLRRPPQNGLAPKMKIAGNHYDKYLNGRCGNGFRLPGGTEWIRIWNPKNDNDEIYATTIHELVHASHWKMDKTTFNHTQTIVKESWARGVEWVLTSMKYSKYPGGSTIRHEYTQVVLDMIDPNYSSLTNNLNRGAWDDNVTGYTIRQIEDALDGQKTWNGWRDNIKNKYNNGTEKNLDALFTFWN